MRASFRLIFSAILLFAVAGACVVLTSSERQPSDRGDYYTWAQVALPSGDWIEGRVERWAPFDDTAMIWLSIGGVSYLTDCENVVLSSAKP